MNGPAATGHVGDRLGATLVYALLVMGATWAAIIGTAVAVLAAQADPPATPLIAALDLRRPPRC